MVQTLVLVLIVVAGHFIAEVVQECYKGVTGVHNKSKKRHGTPYKVVVEQ
jgi:hypothetical protein